MMARARMVLRVAAFVLAGIVLAVPAVFVNTAVGYVPVIFYLFLLLFCYAYCRVSARVLSFDLISSSAFCARGENVSFKVRVGNRSMLFLFGVRARFSVHDLFDNVAHSEDVALNVESRAVRDFQFDLSLPHIGVFQAGVDSVEVRDPLGLFCRTVVVGSRREVTVLPRPHEVDALAFTTENMAESMESLHSMRSDGGDYTSVREYEKGDPLKAIHWKLSAHNDGYLTKLFEVSTEPRLDIYLSFAAPEQSSAQELMDLNDIAVESAFSLWGYAHERGLEAGIIYKDKDGETHRISPDRNFDMAAFIGELPLMGSQDSDVVADEFCTRACALHSADNVVLCSAVVDDAVAQALLRVRVTGKSMSLFALVPKSQGEQGHHDVTRKLAAFSGSDVSCHVLDAGMETLR